jgi:ABC-type glycerol-3-phosphate transport system permease component
MTTGSDTLRLPQKKGGLGLAQRRRIFERGVLLFFIVYAVFTLFPFYGLFVRTFVGTKDSTELHLWLPPQEEANLEGEIGRLAVFYNLDLAKFKEDMGIPATELLPTRKSLREIGEMYDIPEERMKAYFAPFSRFNGWIVLFGSGEFLPAVGRTALITVISLLGMNILAVCTGYGLAGLGRKDQVLWYSLYLLRAVIPPMLIILPQFIIVQWFLNLIPNYETPGFTRSTAQLLAIVSLWIRGGALPAMLMTTAIEAIPKEIEEAAEIDGANPLQYFVYVLLPLMKVPMASLTVIFLPLIWNDFVHPFVYLDRSNTTILPLIQTYSGQYASNFQVIYTGVFLSIVPLVLIYLLFRQWFIRGAMAGAIKG